MAIPDILSPIQLDQPGSVLPARAYVLAGIPVNRSEIPQSTLDIENKTRSNLLPWKGQFSPQFVQALLETYSSKGRVVLDPFMGSGTVLHEAGRLGMAARGAEINPAAYVLARIYRFMNLDLSSRRIYLDRVSTTLREAFPRSMPLFGSSSPYTPPEARAAALSRLHQVTTNRTEAALLEALIVLLDLWKPGLDETRLYGTWHSLGRLVQSLPFPEAPIRVLNCDARHLPLEDDSVDLVVTSPPYINVHNYHQQYRRSTEAIGWDVLAVARSEIGSNRKNRGNRFLTVAEYCLDMAMALAEMRRICRNDARITMILGRESTVRGTAFYNGDIVARLATRTAGLSVEMRQDRVFKNRYGLLVYEDILHFRGTATPAQDALTGARQVAEEVLREAVPEVPPAASEDITAAIEACASIQPSPLYRADNARKPWILRESEQEASTYYLE